MTAGKPIFTTKLTQYPLCECGCHTRYTAATRHSGYVMTPYEQQMASALERLHVAAENFYRGRGYLDAFRLKCALNGTRKLARDE